MTKVYLALSGAPDRLLGRVEADGRVYRSESAFDDQIGHVDLTTGDIYEQRFGPDKKIGHVDLSSGKVYSSRLGPDEHVGQVNDDGRMHLHRSLAGDDYAGSVAQFQSYAHSAGAMLLLVLPAIEPDASGEAPEADVETQE